MGPALRMYAVLLGWREPFSADPHGTTPSPVFRVEALTAQQAIDTALVRASRPSALAELASVHLLSPSEEAEIAGMAAR